MLWGVGHEDSTAKQKKTKKTKEKLLIYSFYSGINLHNHLN